MEYYSSETEALMQELYESLSEKDRRHYAAVEAHKLGHGGVQYIADLFYCSRQTIYRGLEEIKKKGKTFVNRIRAEGGGRKPVEEKHPELNRIFLEIVEPHIAGDPMNEKIRWIKLSRSEICKKFKKRGLEIGRKVIKRLLKNNGFVKRKMQRKTATGKYEFRDQQFKKINRQKKKHAKQGNPVLSMDTKKKEFLGNLHRSGEVYCTQAQEVYDHDYPYLAKGKIVPHGIYDVIENKAHITIGTNNETAEFICDSIKSWWNRHGKKQYASADMIFITCDSGGANSYRSNIFKVELQKLVNKIKIPIKISHYPPYTSKWNPIEHRLFPHVSKAIEGVTFNTPEEAESLIKKTKTATGLKVTTSILKKTYEKGKAVAKDFLSNINIKRDKVLGNLNYMILPAEL